tara:strand:+ start:1036 stop:1623 length:588 start_codon:yes stop_codon:yes gene_type:complete
MSTLKTHNLQSPDASSVNIALAPNAGMVVTGISTFNDDVKLPDDKKLSLGASSDLQIYHDGSHSILNDSQGSLLLRSNIVQISTPAGSKYFKGQSGSAELYFSDNKKFETTNTGVIIAGICTATSFKGDGSQLSNLPASAPVGGSSSNKVFFENDKVISVNYQITSTKNAMTAGPVSVNAGIAVTVPSGCSWTIV